MYAVRQPAAQVELGMDGRYDAADHWIVIRTVNAGGPGDLAGVRAGDRVIAVDGLGLESMRPFDEIWYRSRPGDAVELTVERPGQPERLILHANFGAAQSESSEVGLVKASVLELTKSFPILFLVVGLAVLLLRLDDGNAWLLALLFGGFIAVPGFPSFARLSPGLADFAQAYRASFLGMFGALFYLFFAVFPARSPLARGLPWLKWIGFVLGACIVLPGLSVGDATAPAMFVNLVGQGAASKTVVSFFFFSRWDWCH
jgi:uncharacterized membrane protein YdcZ (DUF606 family)